MPATLEPASSLSAQVREAARRRGIGPSALAAASGVDVAQCSRFLNNRRSVQSHTLDRIAAGLGLRVTVSEPEEETE